MLSLGHGHEGADKAIIHPTDVGPYDRAWDHLVKKAHNSGVSISEVMGEWDCVW